MQLSVWEKESFFAHQDLIIAGSGFTGLWCAYDLKKKHPNLRITILERGIVPTGASTRNAGFACFGSLTELTDDETQMGTDKMLGLVEMRFKGIEKISKVFKKKMIGYDPCGGYEIFSEDELVKKNQLENQINELNKKLAGITEKKKTFRMANEKIKEFGFQGISHMVENRSEGALHSGRLCQSLLTLVQGMGITILNGIAIKDYQEKNEGVEIICAEGYSFTSDRLLVCSNAFARDLLPEIDITPARGQVFVTAPLKDLKCKGTFHYDHGYYYFRNLGNRILIGGARNRDFKGEETENFDTTAIIQTALEQFLSYHILPGIPYRITDRWSGIMAMGKEKSPIVKPMSDCVFCAVRLSGMGVALAPILGEKVATMMYH